MIIKYLKALSPTILICILVTGFCQFFLGGEVYNYIWLCLVYYISITLIAVLLLSRAKKYDNISFTIVSMCIPLGRLLLSGTLLFLYYFYINIDKSTFTFIFFGYYLAYTVCEVTFIKKNIVGQN